MTNTSSHTVRKAVMVPALALLAIVVAVALVGAAGYAALRADGDRVDASQDLEQTRVTTPPTTTPPTAAGVDLSTVSWASVAYPIDCGPDTTTKLIDVAMATPEPGRTVAVVTAACDAGAGSPPRSILAYDRADSASTPHLLQELANDGLGRLTDKVVVAGSSVVATGGSYSSTQVPRCCPDSTFTARWIWSGTQYVPQA